MTGHDYEYVVADWLRKNGYHSVKVTQASGDYGIDVLANKGGYSYAIQCKYYTGAVGVSAVQEAAAGRGYYRCDRAMVVTNSTFTKAAKELASANGVILVEGISKSGHWMPRLGNTPGCLWLCLFPFVWLTCWMFHLFIDLLRICWDGLVYAVSEWLAALKHEEQHGNLEQCEPLFDCEQPCDTGVVDEFESCEAEYDTIRETAPTTLIHQQGPYTKPPFTLLHPPEYTASVAHNVVRKRDALRESISLWGYPVTSVDVSVGRAYTQYRITTEKVIQFSRFIRHHDEISFILGVNDVRITSHDGFTVTIEAANSIPCDLMLVELLTMDAVDSQVKSTNIPIGFDFEGNLVSADLSHSGHLFVTGTAGTGKTSLLHSIILGALYRSRPDEVGLVLISASDTEFDVYNGIPHLLLPTVCSSYGASGVIALLQREMHNRLRLMSETGVKTYEAYNVKTLDDSERITPVLVIIDEMSDILDTCPDAVSPLVQLLLHGDESGIHVIATATHPLYSGAINQVIPHFNARALFSVDSDSFSLQLIGTADGIHLKPPHDVLYKPTRTANAKRIQTAHIHDDEIAATVACIKAQS